MSLSPRSFDLEYVLEAAQSETGLGDFGPANFIEPLEAWLEAGQIPAMTDHGRVAHLDATHRYLVNRLRYFDDLARHPEIHREEVSDPIIVLGFPRSGTTVLQRMLSADPGVQSLRLWRVFNPAPHPNERPGNPVGRIAYAQAIESGIRATNPKLFSAHPSIAQDAEEDWFLHHFSFQHCLNACNGPFTAEYIRYLGALPRLETYRYVGELLKYLQWQDGGRRDRPWILKSPAHIGYLEEIITVHPKATFVYPQRDLTTVMASFCHTLELSLMSRLEVDPHELGSLSMDLWLGEMRRFHASRRRLGDRIKILEIPYLDLLNDPIHYIRRVHSQAGRALGDASEKAIRKWISDNPSDKHGRNTYSLERYGLSGQAVDEAFAEFEGFTPNKAERR